MHCVVGIHPHTHRAARFFFQPKFNRQLFSARRRRPSYHSCRCYAMMMGEQDAASASSGPATAAGLQARDSSGMREIKILMLHGFTQSGPMLRAKTRALEKLLSKSLAALGVRPVLLYPTAPNRLRRRDMPGYEADEGEGEGDGDGDAETDGWAWFRKEADEGRYRLLREGMERVAACVRDEAGGRVHGVVGFSQGGAVAAMVASALEGLGDGGTLRQPPPAADTHDWAWVKALRQANGHRPLRFAVIYSGFYALPPELAWLYDPKISTLTLHFIGSLDTVVEEWRSRGLVARCEDPVVVVHPGGHYVPVSREWAMPLVGFVNKCCKDD